MKSLLCLGLIFALVMAAGCTPAAPSAPSSSAAAPVASSTPAAQSSQDAQPEAPATVDYPTKAITIYNSSSAGSPTDVMAREIARSIELITGQTVNVVNKTGGSGGVMFGALLADKNDGYSIGAVTASQIAALQAGLDKDFPLSSFEFVANVQVEPYAMAVAADSPFQSIEDMIEFAKANPGSLQIGGQGTGSALHLCALKLARDAEFDFVWLPYEGGADSVKNLLGGHANVIMTAPATVREYVEANQIKILAITGTDKLPSQPDVPTFDELGYDIPLTQYRGFFVKSGLDPAVKARISELIREASLADEFVTFMNNSDMADGYMNFEEFTQYALADYDRIGAMAAELLPS